MTIDELRHERNLLIKEGSNCKYLDMLIEEREQKNRLQNLLSYEKNTNKKYLQRIESLQKDVDYMKKQLILINKIGGFETLSKILAIFVNITKENYKDRTICFPLDNEKSIAVENNRVYIQNMFLEGIWNSDKVTHVNKIKVIKEDFKNIIKEMMRC